MYIAFHPDYADNGRFFVYYTTPSPIRTIVAEYARSASDPTAAAPASARVLLSVAQPFQNHNAGQIAFGPDGLFYIALGDGGLGGDPEENGEDPPTLLGSILRIDVDDVPAGAPYGIPEDNPFAPTDGLERDEIDRLAQRLGHAHAHGAVPALDPRLLLGDLHRLLEVIGKYGG